MAAKDASAPSMAGYPGESRAPWLWPAHLARMASNLPARLETFAEAEREQLPLWLPVGLGLGIAAWFALPTAPGWAAFLLAAAAAGIGLLAGAGATRSGRALAIFALAAALGCGLVWGKAERVAAPRLERPQLVQFHATIERVEPLAARDSVRMMLRPLAAPKLPSRLRISVAAKDAPSFLRPGAVIAVRARLMPPAPMALPGAYDFAQTAWFQRIGGSGRALDPPTLVSASGEAGWSVRLADWRQRLSAHIRTQLGGGEGAIADSFATGNQGAVPEADADAMRRSGLTHLLSISGLHVAAVVGAAMLLTIRLLALSPWLALRWPLTLIGAGVGALAGIAYTLFSGAEVPTVRSCIAALLILAGIALGREAMTLRLVAAGALVVLLIWPEALAGPSFQLSFAAVTAIVALHEYPRIKSLLARRDEGMMMRLGRNLLGLLLTGLAVEIALAPIALYHFHRAGLYGAVANIVAIPLTTFVIMPLEALALLFDIGGLGTPFWWLAGQALSLLLRIAHATASAPGAVALLPTMPTAAFALMVGGGLWLMLWRTRWRRLGLIPIAAGALWAIATPAPDILVTGDGRHLALRTTDGGAAILRDRAGDYVRDLFSENAGTKEELESIESLPGAACNIDICAIDIPRNGRRWRLLATRSRYLLPIADMNRLCAAADIIVSDRRLPRTCRPRWLKADSAFLAKSGGLAITLGDRPRVATVAERVGRHPWAAEFSRRGEPQLFMKAAEISSFTSSPTIGTARPRP